MEKMFWVALMVMMTGCGADVAPLIPDELEERVYDDPPRNMGLAYHLEELDLGRGLSHPNGIHRFAKDPQPHPGIDLQPLYGAEILSMIDGTIVDVDYDERFPGDWHIIRIQHEDTTWALEYEPLVPDGELVVGQKVTKGERLGTFPSGYAQQPALIHIDLRRYPDKNFSEWPHGETLCWVDYLDQESRTSLQALWDKEKATQTFMDGWNGASAEGQYFLRGLDPQFCYPWGTDVRQAI
jgi:hypothetical protein